MPEVPPTPLTAQPSEESHPPSLRRLLYAWLSLSMQSFGGGSTTLALIQRTAVQQERWLSETDFNRYWAICQIAPGINLLCITILLGRRVAGLPGILVSLFGLLLPSVSITILMTACYARFQNHPLLKAALHGVIPACVGLGFWTSWKMLEQWIVQGKREGVGSLFVMLLLFGMGVVGMVKGLASVVVILLACGVVGAVACTLLARWGVVLGEETKR